MKNKRFLIVDDSTSMRHIVKKILKKHVAQCDLLEADDGKDAINTLLTEKVDVIITDLAMSGMDGIELVKQARQLENGKFIPIIILSAETDETIAQSRKYGVTAWISKPFTEDDFMKVIRKVTSLKEGGQPP
ncbi:MAG: response regulator [Nitrospirae bacterium]|nr:response regulator [Nitrospirota bacterium]MBF0592514.1 response regulator [Nitrospirota bacterium]